MKLTTLQLAALEQYAGISLKKNTHQKRVRMALIGKGLMTSSREVTDLGIKVLKEYHPNYFQQVPENVIYVNFKQKRTIDNKKAEKILQDIINKN